MRLAILTTTSKTSHPCHHHLLCPLPTLRLLRRFCLLASLVTTLGLVSPVQAQELTFRVWAGDREIGSHRFEVSQQGDEATVLSKAIYNVKVMFINVFKYEHTAAEQWQGNCLSSLQSNTVENGEKTRVDGQLREGVFAVERNGQTLQPASDCVATYAYWDPARLQRTTLMNAQTGEVADVEYRDLGKRPVPRLDQTANAVEISSASSDIQLWYSDEGQWIALQTQADGQPIVYLSESLL